MSDRPNRQSTTENLRRKPARTEGQDELADVLRAKVMRRQIPAIIEQHEVTGVHSPPFSGLRSRLTIIKLQPVPRTDGADDEFKQIPGRIFQPNGTTTLCPDFAA